MKRRYAIDFFIHFTDPESGDWVVERDPNAYLTKNDTQSRRTDDSELYHVQLCGDGQNQHSETLTDIWRNIQEDCEDDAESAIFDEIIARGREDLAKPLYKESVVITETGSRYETDLLWPEKKVILFLTENQDIYTVLNGSNWKCYCTADQFDVDSFIKDIGV